jgi:probable HAF family extracellular repeat protein
VRHRILLALLSLPCVAVARAQVYTITDLGPMAPTSINAWAQVVGNSNGHAFIWERSRGLQGLGTLTGGTSSYAASIDDRGVVTGTADGLGTVISPDSSFPNQQCSDLTQPFVWTPRNGMRGLGTVGVPPFDVMFPFWCEIPFYATGIHCLGKVVGYTTAYEDNNQWAFLWTKAAGMSLFGSGFPPTMVNGISETGQIVGQTGVLIGQATSWKGGVVTDLGTLNGGTDLGFSSSANGVNDQGQVVGWSTTASLETACDFDLAGCPMHAVLWAQSGGISDLGTLSGDTISTALDINFFGQVIGSSGSTLAEQGWGGTGGSGFDGDGGAIAVVGRPFIWSAQGGMRDLNTRIPMCSGWVLNSVSAINVWGQIVGSGTLNGQSRGFLLTP